MIGGITIKFGESLEAGKKFEKYIKSLFETDEFEILQESESYNYDDLDLLIRCKNTRFTFWVECKYRENFKEYEYDGRIFYNIKWSNDAENDFDKFFQKKEPVYLAIGIGRSPDNPARLFFFNFQEILEYTEQPFRGILYREFYIEYEKDTNKKFRWFPEICQ